jgi:spectinomycin phosphotransferase
MLTPPDIADATVVAVLREQYGLSIARVTFLPLGADAYSAVYRLDAADGAAYFLKLRRRNFDEIALIVRAVLHGAGVRRVVAPIATVAGELAASAHGFHWILYPFVAGRDGFAAPLTPAQWRALGASMRAVHTLALPADVAARLPVETYAPQLRERVLAYDAQVAAEAFADPVAARFAAFWRTKRDEIRLIVARAAELAAMLAPRALPHVLCHSDLHAGNVLLRDDGEIAIIDWDEPIMAPKERDLMFIGAGIGRIWNVAEQADYFYEGYGAVAIDATAIAYYRYERIVADLAAYGDQIFGVEGSVADREEGFGQMAGQFGPEDVIGIAHQTYSALSRLHE